MLLGPLWLAVVVVIIAIVVFSFLPPNVDPALRRLLIGLICVIVLALVVAAFWPLIGGVTHVRIGG